MVPYLRPLNKYDAANRPSTSTDGSNGITYATGFQASPGGTCLNNITCYTPQGTFYALSIGQSASFTGLNLTHFYNNRLQPNEFKASSTGGNAIDITYSFVDPSTSKNAGHVYSITNNLNSSRTENFTYDQLNRIKTAGTSATTGPYCWGYDYSSSYDAWGNLQSQPGAAAYTGCSQYLPPAMTADSGNHLSGFGYDLSGNTTGDGVNSYSWNAESQLTASAGVNYLYDGDGRRVSKSSGTLYWYGSGGDILSETDASGNTIAEYVFFGGKRVAMLPGNALPNAGFEQGSQSWNLCSGIPQVITDATRAHSGSNFLWASTSVYACAISNQQVSVSPGEQLTFGGWTYLESGSSLLRWVLVAYDANNNQVGAAAASPNTASPLIWTQEIGTFTVPAGASYVQIYCEIYLPNGTTAARFDDGFITFGSFAGSTPIYYVEDLLGTSRVITDTSGVVCYDADFYPYGGERSYTNSCPQNYKFEGKERDTETGNDDFGARYYSNRFGRWLSADWSAVPAPVPYADLTNPQTLNLYAMVSDDPETFADLDGHDREPKPPVKCGFGCRVVTWFVSLFYSPPTISKSAQRERLQSSSAIKNRSNSMVWEDAEAKRAAIGGMIFGSQPITVPIPGGQNTVGPPMGIVPIPTNLITLLDLLNTIGSATDWVWKGSGPPGSSQGNWYNPNTGEWIHRDFPGGGHGPHFDYEDPQGKRWRVFPDKGTMEPK